MSHYKSLLNKVDAFCEKDLENKLPDGSTIFGKPLVGIASASDPVFMEFRKKDVVGSGFLLPFDWLSEAVTVISYFLPFEESIRKSNYQGPPTSTDWLHGRFLGEGFNNKLRRFIINELQRLGNKAVAPALDEKFKPDYTLFLSNWSERHVAYAAGLGSFGLHRGLITAKGTAGRFGSVITDLDIPATPRAGENPFQNCPFLVDGSCGVCIERCPVVAISEEGKDKAKCHQYMFIQDPVKNLREKFGYVHSVCGKCQVNVPCEDCIP